LKFYHKLSEQSCYLDPGPCWYSDSARYRVTAKSSVHGLCWKHHNIQYHRNYY